MNLTHNTIMPGGVTQWLAKENRKGTFDSYTVLGFKLENATGQIGWRITTQKTPGFHPVHEYWVAGANVYSATTHIFYEGPPYNLIEIHEPPITDGIGDDERKAVLMAISEWEMPEA
jgi:hypothetical protein